jgi:hypothetical protein
VLRRVACGADLVPVVLGTAGEELDLGRVVRLFTRAQRRLLWRRDRGCTYPGCGALGAWCDAHHVVHWADGGLSDIDNAALLCRRHHTVVHSRRLLAQVRERPDERGRHVVWDLCPGGYDRHLEQVRADRATQDPSPLAPERLRELLDVLARSTHTDADDRRWAEHELSEAAESWEEPDSAGVPDEVWAEIADAFETAA